MNPEGRHPRARWVARLVMGIFLAAATLASCNPFAPPTDDKISFYACDAYKADTRGQDLAKSLKADIVAHGWTDAAAHAKELAPEVATAIERLSNIKDLSAASPTMKAWFESIGTWTESLRLASNVAAKGIDQNTDQATLTQITDAVDQGATLSTTSKQKLDESHTAIGTNC